MTQGQITSTVKQRIWCLAEQHTHSPQLPSIPNFHTKKNKKKTQMNKKTKEKVPLSPLEDKDFIFFQLQLYKALFQQRSSPVSASTSNNIRLIRSEGCFLR